MTIKTHNPQLENIGIEGRRGLWYCINIVQHLGGPMYILEHQEYGDLADHIVVAFNGKCFEEIKDEEITDYLLS
jgi:hypothetical protein